jgi:putative ABC transport system permease protein
MRVLSSLKEHGASVLVAALSSAFGVALLLLSVNIAIMLRHDGVTGSSQTVGILLSIVSTVFLVIAIYVGAVVTANSFATIIAGRTRTIALTRLLGSTARAQRGAIAREGLLVGIVGSALGALAGVGITAGLLAVGVATDALPPSPFSYAEPVVLLPIVAVVLTTWLASWVGSRRVLVVSPMEAIGASHERSAEDVARRPARNRTAVVLVSIGTALLLLGVLVGLADPLGVLIGLVGGVFSFTGVVLGAGMIMPRALRLTGRVLGRGPTGRLAAENAVRYPERSTRTTIGVVIGVALVTMFAVALGTYEHLIMLAQQDRPELYAGVETMVMVTNLIISVLVGFSALIAAVGLVNTLSLGVAQRSRELGLLRALGFTAGQLRRMILAEAAQLTVTAVLVGLLLGIGYGWAGAQAMFGSLSEHPALVIPVVPVWLVVAVVVSAALITAVASVAPTRRATRIAPVLALAVE